MIKNKKEARQKRAKSTRAKIKLRHTDRLCVHRTPKHVYAQIIAADGSGVLVSASTLDKEIRGKIKCSGNIDAAIVVGKFLGQRAKKAGIIRAAFDRSGFKYHGRVKALAEAARGQGMEF